MNNVYKIVSWVLFLVGSVGLLYFGFDVTKLVDVIKLLATIVGSVGAVLVPIISLFRKDKEDK